MNLSFKVTGTKFMLQQLKDFPDVAEKAADYAVVSTSRYGIALAKKKIMKQVNLKKGYLDQNMRVEFGTIGGLKSATIIGRARPTSLARFDARQLYAPANNGKKKRAGVTLKVKSQQRKMSKGFLLSLKKGQEQGGNTGLAIRVPTGQSPDRKYNAKPLYKSQNNDVYLLYGPSVQQVFDDVAPEISPELTRHLDREFTRNLVRLRNGK